MAKERDPFRPLSARVMPEAAKWSHSGRKMDDEAALRAARKAGSAQPRRPAGKDKGTRR
jgi:hypothetical protein